jgi:hypothetical protein
VSRIDALVGAGICLLLLVGPIGIVWAIADGLPAYGEGAPSDAGDEWLFTGTNLSAPIQVLIVLALAIWLSRRDDLLGRVAIGVLVLTCMVMIAASIQEPWFPSQEDSPDALLGLFHALLYILAFTVIFLGIAELIAGRRSQRTQLQGGT